MTSQEQIRQEIEGILNNALAVYPESQRTDKLLALLERERRAAVEEALARLKALEPWENPQNQLQEGAALATKSLEHIIKYDMFPNSL